MGLFDHLRRPAAPSGDTTGSDLSAAAAGAEADVPAIPGQEVAHTSAITLAPEPPAPDLSGTDLPAPARERKPGDLVLTVGELLPHLPTDAIMPGLHDADRLVAFRTEDLSSDIAKGRAAMPLSKLAQLCPDLVSMPANAGVDQMIRLPLQKLVEQLSASPMDAAEDDSPVRNPQPARPVEVPPLAETRGDLIGAAPVPVWLKPPERISPVQPRQAKSFPSEHPSPSIPRRPDRTARIGIAAATPLTGGFARKQESEGHSGLQASAGTEPGAITNLQSEASRSAAGAPFVDDQQSADASADQPISSALPERDKAAQEPAAAGEPPTAVPETQSSAPEKGTAAFNDPIKPSIPAVVESHGSAEQPSMDSISPMVNEPSETNPKTSEQEPSQHATASSQGDDVALRTFPTFGGRGGMPAPPRIRPPAPPPPVLTTPAAGMREALSPSDRGNAAHAAHAAPGVQPSSVPAKAEPAAELAAVFAEARMRANIPQPTREASHAAGSAEIHRESVSSTPNPDFPKPEAVPSEASNPAPAVPSSELPPSKADPSLTRDIEASTGPGVAGAGEPSIAPAQPQPVEAAASTERTAGPVSEEIPPRSTWPSFSIQPSNRFKPAAAESHFTASPSTASSYMPPLPLTRYNQESLQVLFMTEEILDIAALARHVAALPGMQACALFAASEAAHAGTFPPGFDLGVLQEMGVAFVSSASAFGGRLLGREMENVTLQGGGFAVTLFARTGLCLCVIHRARGFLPGVREKLAAVADELARVSGG